MLIADRDGRVVVTKDDDFVQSFLLRNTPQRLMLVASGNIGNTELERLIIATAPLPFPLLEFHAQPLSCFGRHNICNSFCWL